MAANFWWALLPPETRVDDRNDTMIGIVVKISFNDIMVSKCALIDQRAIDIRKVTYSISAIESFLIGLHQPIYGCLYIKDYHWKAS